MPITVELQDMFSYSLLLVAIAVVLVAIIGMTGLLIFLLKKKAKQPEEVKPSSAAKPVSGNQVKEKYETAICDLETEYRKGGVPERNAYQELSRLLRHFVYEVTGIKVHHNTLEEIKELDMPGLCAVIEACYAPEFSVDQSGDIYDTMNRARMVIKEWH